MEKKMKKRIILIILGSIIFSLGIVAIYTLPSRKVQPHITPNQSISSAIHVVAAGDIACSGEDKNVPCREKDTARIIDILHPDIVLPLGDTQYEKGEYAHFLARYDMSWGKFKSITHPVVGNHEYGIKRAQGYFDYFNGLGKSDGIAGKRDKGYYSFDRGNWHFIALNSNCHEVGGCEKGSPEEKWLQEDLSSHPTKCTIAYWHHPLFSSGEHGYSDRYVDFWRDLYTYGVDIVLVGHDHDYERFAPQDPTGKLDSIRGIREFVVGTGGRNLYTIKEPTLPNSEIHNSKTFGVLELTLEKEKYAWKFIPIEGQTFTDQGENVCHT